MPELSIESLTILDEYMTKNHPEVSYEGAIPEDADEMDYVCITMKGVVVA